MVFVSYKIKKRIVQKDVNHIDKLKRIICKSC